MQVTAQIGILEPHRLGQRIRTSRLKDQVNAGGRVLAPHAFPAPAARSQFSVPGIPTHNIEAPVAHLRAIRDKCPYS
ncbi:hypothetical protein FRAHR75_1090021 [Frankia sp. Hr75.2]|nr:hypothetical protein FRAHR75_1090021 [Frankia sp. Hr75.2]